MTPGRASLAARPAPMPGTSVMDAVSVVVGTALAVIVAALQVLLTGGK